MIICLKTRLGEVHIINWTTSRSQHYTICGKVFANKQNVETFAADAIFPGICNNCYTWQKDNDLFTAEEDAREIKPDQIISTSMSIYLGIQKGWESIQDKFEDTPDRRYWAKKNKMRRKFPSEEIRTKRYQKTYGQSKRK